MNQKKTQFACLLCVAMCLCVCDSEFGCEPDWGKSTQLHYECGPALVGPGSGFVAR